MAYCQIPPLSNLVVGIGPAKMRISELLDTKDRDIWLCGILTEN